MNPNRLKVLIAALLGVSSICAGCSSTAVTHASCDFVVGAASNDRNVRLNTSSDSTPSAEDNLIVGIFSVITGAINRALFEDKERDGCNTPL
ncbi:hypothetical protein [Shewanella cyperi]|uniref:hypothetical protein n=1 Tax=Shewanella cyperi TaxID=2814292 RepID=UPI001A93C213|nr:hypothetical protein [Shewanella cyperi]QSX39875.1 hypothetical protein JYB84_12805 [Shewanella cyperi]